MQNLFESTMAVVPPAPSSSPEAVSTMVPSTKALPAAAWACAPDDLFAGQIEFLSLCPASGQSRQDTPRQGKSLEQ
ncbi:hypothetical protein [Paracoccus cavernae]|uniref:hypothetical protein n=1 Tax=Paracoccus cavernae TaxID=1571207 RepID=UPI003638AC3C